MSTNKIAGTARSVIADKLAGKARESLGPVYRATLYNLVQPVQNWIRFRRRLSKVPVYDLENRDVLFLVVDCLRNDHISRSGYDRETTPFLDSVGNYYPNCISAAPWTYPSVPSILTGLYPHNHGAVFESEYRNKVMDGTPASVRGDVYTLPEILARTGYETYLSTAIATAEIPVRGRFKQSNIYHDSHYNAPAKKLVTRLIDWWDSTDGSRFGYVHFGDLHTHLRRPEQNQFGKIPDIPDIEHWNFTHSTEPREEFEAYRRAKLKLYDSILHYVDDQFRRLFQALADRDDLEDTLIVIVGDHGEEFWDRVELEQRHFDDPRDIYGTGHGHALIPEVLSVPLIISGGNDQPTSNWVSTTDIVPTVLSELGLKDESLLSYDGFPLQESIPSRAVLAEEIAYGYDQQAVVRDNYHLINSPHENESIIIDLDTDKIIENHEVEKELKSHIVKEKQRGKATELTSETQERLADLGYM